MVHSRCIHKWKNEDKQGRQPESKLQPEQERKIHMKSMVSRIAAGLFAVAIVQGTVGGTVVFAAAEYTQNASYSDYSSGVIPKVIQTTSPSVVAIIGKPSDDENDNRFALAHGTGVIVRSNGYIITNAHVVKDMKTIVVVTYDGKQYNGTTTHLDEESDLALVKIEAEDLKEAVFAPKVDLQVGETVVAIGTPMSFALRNSVTVGVISGLDRSVNSKYRLLQTDAAINPGNSGGALVNMKGEVVGINTLKLASYGVENLGFAIPADTVQYVVNQFLTYGKVKRAYFGAELEESWAAVVGLPSDEPLKVTYVDPDSPAAKAGVKAGEWLLSLDQTSVKTVVGFNELLKNYSPGQTAVLTLKSENGESVKRELVFGEEPVETKEQWKNGSNDTAGIDKDAGKTWVGDSHYGWAIKYPSGLAKTYQSLKGNNVAFRDAKDHFILTVSVAKKHGELSKAALLKALDEQREYDMTVLDRQVVEHNGVSYARIISKDDYSYYESRGYDNGSYLYYVTLESHDDQESQNNVKRRGFSDLLDSFGFAYDSKDPAFKDITVYKDGYHQYTNEGYGFSVSVPTDWFEDKEDGYDIYANKDSTRYVAVKIASLAEGDTLDAWVGRKIADFEDSYLPDYRTVGEVTDTVVAGIPAKAYDTSESMGDKWTSAHHVYFVKDGYKYSIEIGYPKDADSKESTALIGKVLTSLEWKPEGGEEDIGFIQDDEDLLDKSRTVTLQQHGYIITIPEYWSSNNRGRGGAADSEEGTDGFEYYSFTGGSFVISSDSKTSYEDAVKRIENAIKKNKESDADYKTSSEELNLFDTTGKRFVVNYKTKGVPYESTQYVFRKNNVTYTIITTINNAVRTEANLKRLEDAVHSFQTAESEK